MFMFDWVTIPLVYTQVGYEFLSAITLMNYFNNDILLRGGAIVMDLN